jgi:hypothetical protein
VPDSGGFATGQDLAQHLYDRIPGDYFKVCSRGQYEAARYVPRVHLPDYEEVEPNKGGFIGMVNIDLDNGDLIDNIFDLQEGLRPNLVVRNRENGHGHAQYFFEAPAFGRTVEFAKDVKQRLSFLLGGDPSYHGRFVHNPLADFYEVLPVREQLHQLSQLGRNKALPSLRRVGSTSYPAQGIRRLTHIWADRGEPTFEVGRRNGDCFWTAVEHGQAANRNRQDVEDVILTYVSTKNDQINDPLFEREVITIVTSAIRYVRKHPGCRFDPTWQVGVMALDKTIPYRTRQSMAAARTNRVRSRNAMERVRLARQQSPLLGIGAIARQARVDRNTARKYWGSYKSPNLLASCHPKTVIPGKRLHPPRESTSFFLDEPPVGRPQPKPKQPRVPWWKNKAAPNWREGKDVAQKTEFRHVPLVPDGRPGSAATIKSLIDARMARASPSGSPTQACPTRESG